MELQPLLVTTLPASAGDTFLPPLVATDEAFVVIHCHRNHFLHAASSKSSRTAAGVGWGKGKTACRGRCWEENGTLFSISSFWKGQKNGDGFADLEESNFS